MAALVQYIKNLGYLRIGLSALGILMIVGIILFFSIGSSSKPLVVLYSGLSVEDSSNVVAELEKEHFEYQVIGDGTIIKAPQDQVGKIRMLLAQRGIPNKNSTVGYEIFDKEEGLGTTNFLQNVKMLRALEGELARTIQSFEQVSKARVHLVMPQKEIFAKTKEEPKASIVVTLQQGKTLSKGEIEAIAHLISTSVPGLDPKNITIVDTKGKSLKIGSGEDLDFASGKNDEYRVAYEHRITKAVEELLEKSLGVGKVKVQIAAELNFDRVVINSEQFDPNTSTVRSTQSSDESERTPVGGSDNLDISVANNLPGSQSAEQELGLFATSNKSNDVINYEISKTIKNQISEVGAIQRLSVAVLVDGTYTNDKIYVPRSNIELAQIEKLVKVAIGYNEDRNDTVQVINMQFATDLIPEEPKSESLIDPQIQSILQMLIIALAAIAILVLVVKPLASKAFEITKSSKDGLTPSLDLSQYGNISGGREADMTPEQQQTNKLAEVVKNHPEEAVMIFRKWLNEG